MSTTSIRSESSGGRNGSSNSDYPSELSTLLGLGPECRPTFLLFCFLSGERPECGLYEPSRHARREAAARAGRRLQSQTIANRLFLVAHGPSTYLRGSFPPCLLQRIWFPVRDRPLAHRLSAVIPFATTLRSPTRHLWMQHPRARSACHRSAAARLPIRDDCFATLNQIPSRGIGFPPQQRLVTSPSQDTAGGRIPQARRGLRPVVTGPTSPTLIISTSAMSLYKSTTGLRGSMAFGHWYPNMTVHRWSVILPILQPSPCSDFESPARPISTAAAEKLVLAHLFAPRFHVKRCQLHEVREESQTQAQC